MNILCVRTALTSHVNGGIFDHAIASFFDLSDSIVNAAALNQIDTVKYLVSIGANFHKNDDEVLHVAISCVHLSIIKYLLSTDTNMHAYDDYGLVANLKSIKYFKHSKAHQSVVDYFKSPECPFRLRF